MDNEKVIGVLNDLIRINHDRVVGYEKAIDELKDEDADLRVCFSDTLQKAASMGRNLLLRYHDWEVIRQMAPLTREKCTVYGWT